MCTKTRFGRARHRYRKLLNGLGLCHGHRSGDADPGLRAVDGSDPGVSMPSACIAEGWDVHIPDTLRTGSLPVHQSLREGVGYATGAYRTCHLGLEASHGGADG